MKHLPFITSTLFFAIMNASTVQAEEKLTDFGSTAPSTEQLIDALSPPKRVSDEPKIKMRGITMRKESDDIKQQPVAINLSLTFGFDSDQLTQQTKNTLDKLGPALQTPHLQNFTFRIEGYTDALGEASYNSNLSKRRAEAVKQYLTDKYAVSSSRLEVVGKGESDLLDPDHPGSEKNRRVKIINLGATSN